MFGSITDLQSTPQSDRVWHYMRDNITRSTFYITLVKLCEALVDWLKKLPFERFQSLLGLSP
jgi:hypothetical protein